MDLIDTPPLRRGTEKNCTGRGYDWGKNSHTLPGRRVGEPNHGSLSLGVSAGSGKADGMNDRTRRKRSEHTSGKIDEGCGDALRSLARVVQVLEWMRSKRNDNGDQAPQSVNWPAEVIQQIQTMWGEDWLPVFDYGNTPKIYGQCIPSQNENTPPLHHFNKK